MTTHAGECPKCHTDIAPDDMALPCAMCGAEPPPTTDQPMTYTLYDQSPSGLHAATILATFATTQPREALHKARTEGGDRWTLVIDAGTNRARIVFAHIQPRVSTPDDEAERKSENEARDRLFGQPHHGHDREDDLV
jgi:hypothetical protein